MNSFILVTYFSYGFFRTMPYYGVFILKRAYLHLNLSLLFNHP